MRKNKGSVISYLAAKAYEKNIPVYSIIELTKRCNLSCRHCYIPQKERKARPPSPLAGEGRVRGIHELSLREIKDILKQLKELGTLFLTFTGGEVFLRPDIFDLLALARKLNFDLRVFTNATLVSAGKAKNLKQLGVSVEVSIYGGKIFHNSITGVEGSFNRTLRGINELISAGIKPHIKCVLFGNPEKQYKEVKKIAGNRKLPFTFDPVISGTEMKKFRIRGKNIPFIRRITEIGTGQEAEASILCGAGKNMLAIDSRGRILPCLAMEYKLGNIRKDEIGSVWKYSEKLKKLRNVEIRELECRGCGKINSCIRCPGVALEESGSIYSKSPTACRIMLKKNRLLRKY